MAAGKKVDTTLVVLREIRDELKEMRAELRSTNERVDTLHRLHVESEIRLASAVTDLHGATKDLASVVRETRAAERIARLEGENRDLEHRLTAIERKVG